MPEIFPKMFDKREMFQAANGRTAVLSGKLFHIHSAAAERVLPLTSANDARNRTHVQTDA